MLPLTCIDSLGEGNGLESLFSPVLFSFIFFIIIFGNLDLFDGKLLKLGIVNGTSSIFTFSSFRFISSIRMNAFLGTVFSNLDLDNNLWGGLHFTFGIHRFGGDGFTELRYFGCFSSTEEGNNTQYRHK